MEHLLSQLKHEQPLEAHISYKLSHEFKKRMQPFMDAMGLAYFSIHFADKKGNFTMLYTDPEVERIIYNPANCHLGAFQAGLNRYHQLKEGLKEAAIERLKTEHQLTYGLSIHTKASDEYHYIHGAISESTDSQQPNLIFQPDILMYAKNHALEHCLNLIQEAKTQYLDFPLKSTSTAAKLLCAYWKNRIEEITKIHKRFRSQKACFRYKGRFTKLSNREFECLLLLISRETNKQIASQMKVSIKHIERTIAKIKDKLGCYSREQLIEAAYYNGLIEDCQPYYLGLDGNLKESWSTP